MSTSLFKSNLKKIEIVPLTGFNKQLVYTVPIDMQNSLHIGSLVSIPLGRRYCLGLVIQLNSDSMIAANKIKNIQKIIYPEPVLTHDLIVLALWISKYYAASIDSVWEAVLPKIIRNIKKHKIEHFFLLAQDFSEDILSMLQKKSPKQAIIYSFLADTKEPQSIETIKQKTGLGSSVLKALIQKKIVIEKTNQKNRIGYEDDLSICLPSIAPPLNEEQKKALDSILESIHKNIFSTHLLHGVTGSGKTEVYLGAIEHVVKNGGSALLLVPEVVLTPQTVNQVRSRLQAIGVKTIVWHSHLSEGERFDAWFMAIKGQAQVVVGARSAIFLPMKNLQLIIVDEEHEPAYKQDKTPTYHARDLAVYRSKLNNITCVLGSATPSLESLYNTQVKGYTLNLLTKRIDNRSLPIIHVVDMKLEVSASGDKGSILSNLLVKKLKDRLEKKEQSILFLNKRGYATSLLCPDCAFVEVCKHCSVSLTYHKTQQLLRCHMCNFSVTAPIKCPQCNSHKIRWKGFGTQKIEDILGIILPHAKIARMDTDILIQKNHFRQVLNDFRLGKIDILIGTQMIAKGLDFPNVTLVGLVDADLSMHQQDFRASERTFQLLVQVAGRAGRGERLGEVIIQTFTPHADAIQFARHSDFIGFLDGELKQRKEFHYPPFRHLIRHIFRCQNLEKLVLYTEKWTQSLEQNLGNQVEIRGPSPAPIEKIKDHYRYHIWYFVSNVSKTLPLIMNLRESFIFDSSIIEILDVDPISMV